MTTKTAAQLEPGDVLTKAGRTTHRPNSITVCGSPISTDSFVADTLLVCATSLAEQIAKRSKLPLATQSHFVLLRSHLSLRIFHLQRSLPWDQMAPSIHRVQQAIFEALSTGFRLPSAMGPDVAP